MIKKKIQGNILCRQKKNPRKYFM